MSYGHAYEIKIQTFYGGLDVTDEMERWFKQRPTAMVQDIKIVPDSVGNFNVFVFYTG